MTEDQKRILADFEFRLRKLIELCDKQQKQINELTKALDSKECELSQAREMIGELKTRCDNLLTARVVSVNEEELKSAKSRISKLVREVDKCIALLNE